MLSPENFKETQELIGREYKPSYPEKYYQYLREEIEREDNITNQRLTWTITFQGFLINAMAFLFVFFWDTSIGIYFVRKLALIAIGFIGLQIGFITYIGVMASRDSIRRAKINWTWRDEIWKLYPNSVPQTFGQGNTFHGGTIHAERIPRLFIWMWSAYLIGYITLISVFEIYPYGSLQGVSPESFFECLYNQRTGGSSTSILKYLFDLWNGN